MERMKKERFENWAIFKLFPFFGIETQILILIQSFIDNI